MMRNYLLFQINFHCQRKTDLKVLFLYDEEGLILEII